ncbi:MAG: DUF4131 domain-containing protein, partial [Rhodospirillaceae bacterium]
MVEQSFDSNFDERFKEPGWLEALTERLFAERERWGLWLPVGFGAGILLYFALSFEPPVWLGPGATLFLAAAGFTGRERPTVWLPVVVFLTATTGFSAAQLRTALVAAPVLQRDLGIVALTGRVITTEFMAEGVRLTLAEVRIDKLAPADTPNHVRIRLSARFSRPEPGALVQMRVMLHQPPPPAEPGAYDFQRQAFFDGNGAIGYALETPHLIDGPPPSFWQSLVLPMERLRARFAERCAEVLPDKATATVTAALLNGEQTGIPADIMNDYRYSGLAHFMPIGLTHTPTRYSIFQ